MVDLHPGARPGHPLEYWLSPELARVSPPNAPSRLRQLADAQGTMAAAWSSAIASGPILVLAGALMAVMSGNPAAALVLAPLGAALMLLALSRWKRVRTTLPNTDRLLSSRGPGSARGGIAMVSFLVALLGGILAIYLPSAIAKGDGAATTLVAAFALIVAIVAACIVVPSTVIGRARESFRRRVRTDPALRKVLEEDLATWRDPYGNAAYGPL